MKWLELAKLILSLLPTLIAAIQAVEEAIPGERRGEVKLAAIRAILEASYAAASDGVGKFEQIWPLIQSTIAVLVNTFNASGIFKKG